MTEVQVDHVKVGDVSFCEKDQARHASQSCRRLMIMGYKRKRWFALGPLVMQLMLLATGGEGQVGAIGMWPS